MPIERDDRLSHEEIDPEREPREMEDREITEDPVLNDEERLDALRSHMFSSPMPDLPKMAGYHVCWLTTTNPRDSILQRRRMGYEFITERDVPEFESLSLKSGEFQGAISVNEMIAMKLPMRLYEMYMKEMFHDAPNREEEKLSAVLAGIRERAQAAKADVQLEQGSAELGKGPRRPIFDDTDTYRRRRPAPVITE